MKRGLLALVAVAGTALNALAGGLEQKQNDNVIIDCVDYKIEAKGGYGSNGNRGPLKFELYDSDTRVIIFDGGKRGIGDEGDFVNCSHCFSGEKNLFIELRCRGGGYGIKGTLNGRDGFSTKMEFDPDKNLFIINLFAMGQINCLKSWGGMVYENLVDSILRRTKLMDVPYGEVKRALWNVKKLLPKIEKRKLGLSSALVLSSDEILSLANKRTRKENVRKER